MPSAYSLSAHFLLTVSGGRHLVYFLETADEGFRVFIAYDTADFRNRNPGIAQQGHGMVHFNISDKGHKSDAGFLPDQPGAVGDRIVELLSHFFQRYGSVVIVDVA